MSLPYIFRIKWADNFGGRHLAFPRYMVQLRNLVVSISKFVLLFRLIPEQRHDFARLLR